MMSYSSESTMFPNSTIFIISILVVNMLNSKIKSLLTLKILILVELCALSTLKHCNAHFQYVNKKRLILISECK